MAARTSGDLTLDEMNFGKLWGSLFRRRLYRRKHCRKRRRFIKARMEPSRFSSLLSPMVYDVWWRKREARAMNDENGMTERGGWWAMMGRKQKEESLLSESSLSCGIRCNGIILCFVAKNQQKQKQEKQEFNQARKSDQRKKRSTMVRE